MAEEKYRLYNLKANIDPKEVKALDMLMINDNKIYLSFVLDLNNTKHKVGIVRHIMDKYIEVYTTEKVADWINCMNLEIKTGRDQYNKLYFYCNTRLFPGVHINRLEYSMYEDIFKNIVSIE